METPSRLASLWILLTKAQWYQLQVFEGPWARNPQWVPPWVSLLSPCHWHNLFLLFIIFPITCLLHRQTATEQSGSSIHCPSFSSPLVSKPEPEGDEQVGASGGGTTPGASSRWAFAIRMLPTMPTLDAGPEPQPSVELQLARGLVWRIQTFSLLETSNSEWLWR